MSVVNRPATDFDGASHRYHLPNHRIGERERTGMSVDALLAIIAGQDSKGLFEVRCRSPRTGRIAAREWFPVAARRAECVDFMAAKSRRLDVYIGTAPRVRREGGKSAIHRVWCLWADCDAPEAVERLTAFRPAPSLVVRSGTAANVHAYWALEYPLSPSWAERANRRLALALGADVKATDAARILRPPGTLNHKSDPPTSVNVASHSGSRFSVLSVVKTLPDPGKTARKRQAGLDVHSDDPLKRIPADHYYTVLTGRPLVTGNVQCPFHGNGQERNPSMRLYDTTWYCFVCCKGGSVYQFGSMLWNVGTRGADFGYLRERLTDALC